MMQAECISPFMLITNGLEIVRDRWDSLGSAGILLVPTQVRTGGAGGLRKSKELAGRRRYQNHRALLTAFCAGFPV